MQVPTTLKSSQLFIPCAFVITPMVASRLRQRNIPDCLGRSVSHILYDTKSLKEWPPSDMYTIDNLRRTSLYLACYDGDHDRVQQLARANVNPNVEASNGLYPLDIAVIPEIWRYVKLSGRWKSMPTREAPRRKPPSAWTADPIAVWEFCVDRR